MLLLCIYALVFDYGTDGTYLKWVVVGIDVHLGVCWDFPELVYVDFSNVRTILEVSQYRIDSCSW
jgi:hypothetical protein